MCNLLRVLACCLLRDWGFELPMYNLLARYLLRDWGFELPMCNLLARCLLRDWRSEIRISNVQSLSMLSPKWLGIRMANVQSQVTFWAAVHIFSLNQCLSWWSHHTACLYSWIWLWNYSWYDLCQIPIARFSRKITTDNQQWNVLSFWVYSLFKMWLLLCTNNVYSLFSAWCI